MYKRITDSRPNRSPIVCAPPRKRPLSAGALHPDVCSGTDVADAAAPETEEVVVSRFTEKMYRNARTVTTGMVTGEPYEPVRQTWGEVHERARRIAGGLAAAGIGHGDAVGVLAGFPVEIAQTAQGLWMRGASLTMLHQPTPRPDLGLWTEDLMTVIGKLETKAVSVADPLLARGLRKQAEPGQFDLSTLRFALSGAEPVEPADVEDLLDAGKPFGLRPDAILPAYGMAETTLAVSFSECGAGLVVDEVDADLLAALRRAVPSTKGNTPRLASLGPLLTELQAPMVGDNGEV